MHKRPLAIGKNRLFGGIMILGLVGVDFGLGHLIDPLGDWAKKELVRIFVPPSGEEHPKYQYGLKKSFNSREMFGSISYPLVTDQYGFRYNQVSRRDSPGCDRWIFIGDSFTYGSGVEYSKSFVARIADLRANVDVLNAAVPSYSPANYRAKIMHFLENQKLCVKEVVIFIDISDPFDERNRVVSSDGSVAPKRSGAPTPPGGQALTPAGGAKDADLSFRHWLRTHSLSFRIAYALKDLAFPPRMQRRLFHLEILYERGMWTVDKSLWTAYAAAGLRASAENLRVLAEFLRGRDVGLTVVVYPWPHQIVVGDVDSLQTRFWREWSSCIGARFVDLFPAFFAGSSADETIESYFITNDVHLNLAGHDLIAAQFLEKWPKSERQGKMGSCPDGLDGLLSAMEGRLTMSAPGRVP